MERLNFIFPETLCRGDEMGLTYTDMYANIGPDPQAAAYFNDLPEVIQAQILAKDPPPSSLDALKKLVKEADYIF